MLVYIARFKAFEDYMESIQSSPQYSNYNIYYHHSKGNDNGLQDMLTHVMVDLLPIAFILVLTLSVAFLTRWPLYSSNGTLAFYCILLTALALSAGYGLSAYLSIPITLFSYIIPFLVFATGLDGAFVLIAAMQ